MHYRDLEVDYFEELDGEVWINRTSSVIEASITSSTKESNEKQDIETHTHILQTKK